MHEYKIVLLGDGGVGKTSLIESIVKDRAAFETVSTQKSMFLCKNVKVDGVEYVIEVLLH